MRYVSLADLSKMIRSNINLIPHDIDLVVGVPRSGMLAATMIALYLNKSLTDLESFVYNRITGGGERTKYIKSNSSKKILIVDDSVDSGRAILKAKEKLKDKQNQYNLIYCSPIVTTKNKDLVDIYFEIIDDERIFEWNIFHHSILNHSCMDIDGVLNIDPDVDDDGEQYRKFLNEATPLFVPSVPVHTLISCRLEKYRQQTEEWLKKHNVTYKELILLDMLSKEEREKWNKHGEYKAMYYLKSKDTYLFIESSAWQAKCIAEMTHKYVFCVETNQLLYVPPIKPTLLKRIKKKIKQMFPFLYDIYVAFKFRRN